MFYDQDSETTMTDKLNIYNQVKNKGKQKLWYHMQ